MRETGIIRRRERNRMVLFKIEEETSAQKLRKDMVKGVVEAS